jgi:hypothetical protein
MAPSPGMSTEPESREAIMRIITLSVVLLLTVSADRSVVGQDVKREKPVDVPAGKAAQPAAAVDPERQMLKWAAHRILSPLGCGMVRFDPDYQQAFKLFTNTGAAILPVVAELVAEEDTSVYIVTSAAWTATRYPLCEPLRAALRNRRTDPKLRHDNYEAMCNLFNYFVKFGDASDLCWLEKATGQLQESQRKLGEERVKELRERLRAR